MMTKPLLLMCSALLLVSAPVASAVGFLNNAWDTCVGDGGTLLRTSACTSNSNTGVNTNVAVQSIILDTPMPAYMGVVCFINVVTAGSTLPSWWSCPGKLTPFSSAGGSALCNNDAYAMSGAPTGGLAATNIAWNGPNTVQGIYALANAVGLETDLEAGLEYFLGSITISNEKTTGADACVGCAVPACIGFAQANVDHLVNGVAYTDIVRYPGYQRSIYWQSSGDAYECYWYEDPTPTHTSTWGAIKSLYR